MVGLLLQIGAPARAGEPTEIILHSFSGPDGAHPLGGVIVSAFQSADAATQPLLLGTAYSGGLGGGTVFAIQNGTLTTLHNFAPDGVKFPQAGLTQGPGGVLYGTLSSGGDRSVSSDGNGAVFALRPAGQVAILHKFHGPEGAVPVAPVSLDAAGDVLGAAKSGGAIGYAGTLYKITPDGTASALVDFSKTRCQGPIAPLTLEADGTIISTAWMGPENPAGCVWEYSASHSFKLVHKFNNGMGGREPRGGVVPGAGGVLYGTAYYSGNYGPGTLFAIAPDGTETVLHHFHCGTDGGYPYSSVLSDGHGMLFGTAASCGANGGGVVFSYDTIKGVYRVLHAFSNTGTDGYLPIGPLAMDPQGNLYGATEYGGDDNLGIVFEIKR